MQDTVLDEAARTLENPRHVARPVIVEYYREHRIDVNAIAVDGRFNAEVRIRRILSQDKPHVEAVTCYKLTAEHAERAAEVWAKRWVDLKTEGA